MKGSSASRLLLNLSLLAPLCMVCLVANGKEIYKLQLPKGLTVLEEAYCVPSEEESFNQGVRNPAGGIASNK